MKNKLIALILLLCITFTGCVVTPPVDCTHKDLDKNGICDICQEKVEKEECVHKDTNNDEICDLCQIPMSGGIPGSDGSCTHTDADDNGICDGCSISVLIEVDFYNVNDLHGKLDDGDSHIGVDELNIWGDYFYTEALHRMLDSEWKLYW